MTLPDPPTAVDVDPAFGNYQIAGGGAETAPSRPPRPVLVDAWYASFPDPAFQTLAARGVNELVHGADTRRKVENTRIAPFKWTAMLEITARNGSHWRGTGWLAGAAMIVTAGHCVYLHENGGWATSITVRLGVDATQAGTITAQAAPAQTATQFRSVTGWTTNKDLEADYGAILLPAALPDAYGRLAFAAEPDSALTATALNITGYPADKAPYTQWFDGEPPSHVTGKVIQYATDSYGGQSGGPAYHWDEDRTVVGIHVRGGPVSNDAIRITPAVATNLTRWSADADDRLPRRPTS